MFVIDTNALVLLIIGTMDKRQISQHKRTSLFDENDFDELLDFIGDIKNLIILPNVWTETDNLLNNFSGNLKYPYIETTIQLIKECTEVYRGTLDVVDKHEYSILGVTDTLLLHSAKEYRALITSDSNLSDTALSNGISVYDMVAIKNEKIRKY